MKTNTLLLPVLAVAALSLSACGGGGTPGVSSAPSSSTPASSTEGSPAAPATTAASSTEVPASITAPATTESSSQAPSPATSAAAGGKSYGPSGTLPAVDMKALPKTVGETTLEKSTESGGYTYATYSDANGADYSVGGVLSSSATDLAKESIKKSETKVGAGVCGVTGGDVNFGCYLQTKKGTLSVTASAGWKLKDGSEMTLEDVIAFVGHFEAALG